MRHEDYRGASEIKLESVSRRGEDNHCHMFPSANNEPFLVKLYIYPIKSLRPCLVQSARLKPEGLEHDRRFMLLKVQQDGTYKSVQTVYMPECTLFSQELVGDSVKVQYHIPEKPLFTPNDDQRTTLTVPLRPNVTGCESVEMKLMGSPGQVYRMGDPYDAWFTSCLGYEAHLVYIGDRRRPVLAHSPNTPTHTPWLGSVMSYLTGWAYNQQDPNELGGDSLVFNECAPFLITSRASLRDVSTRLEGGMDMIKFRPNIVVDDNNDADSSGSGSGSCSDPLPAWDEDYWSEVQIAGGRCRLALTANCARCASINVDYATGRPAHGDQGNALKKLMKDRRVDTGNKWSPIFGRYAFMLRASEKGNLAGGGSASPNIQVGDEVTVTKRNNSRDVWVWPKYSA